MGLIDAPRGLAGVVVAETSISDVRGEEGSYQYRDRAAIPLAETATFEDAWHLLVTGSWPTDAESERFADRAAAAREMPELDGIRVPGHAGQFETATQMAQRADLVHLQRAARDHDRAEAPEMPGVRIETSGLWQSFDGYTDRPDLATSALGEAILATVIREVAALMTRLGPGIA